MRARHQKSVTPPSPPHPGPVVLQCLEDNSYVKRALEESGAGRVLVVDGGSSLRCALLGDQLAALALKNGWAGVVVFGCVRDAAALRKMALGVKAVATVPLRSVKRDVGERDVPLAVSGFTVRPGDWIYSDVDGVLVSRVRLDAPLSKL